MLAPLKLIRALEKRESVVTEVNNRSTQLFLQCDSAEQPSGTDPYLYFTVVSVFWGSNLKLKKKLRKNSEIQSCLVLIWFKLLKLGILNYLYQHI